MSGAFATGVFVTGAFVAGLLPFLQITAAWQSANQEAASGVAKGPSSSPPPCLQTLKAPRWLERHALHYTHIHTQTARRYITKMTTCYWSTAWYVTQLTNSLLVNCLVRDSVDQ